MQGQSETVEQIGVMEYDYIRDIFMIRDTEKRLGLQYGEIVSRWECRSLLCRFVL